MLKYLFAKPDSADSKWIDVPDSAEVFTYHQKNAGQALLGGFLLAGTVETVVGARFVVDVEPLGCFGSYDFLDLVCPSSHRSDPSICNEATLHSQWPPNTSQRSI